MTSGQSSINIFEPHISLGGFVAGQIVDVSIEPQVSMDEKSAGKSRQIRIVTLNSQEDTKDPIARTCQPYSSAVVFRTFIPEREVSLNLAGASSFGLIGQNNVTFGGDGRGFIAPFGKKLIL